MKTIDPQKPLNENDGNSPRYLQVPQQRRSRRSSIEEEQTVVSPCSSNQSLCKKEKLDIIFLYPRLTRS